MMEEKLYLSAEESPVSMGGRARISMGNLKALGITEGSKVVISSERKDILVNVYSDELVEEDCIIIRGDDIQKLSIEEGEKVRIRTHRSLIKHKLLDKLL